MHNKYQKQFQQYYDSLKSQAKIQTSPGYKKIKNLDIAYLYQTQGGKTQISVR